MRGPGRAQETKMKRVSYLLCCLGVCSTALVFTHSAKAQATDDDKKFLAMAAQSDVNEITLSKLAEDKATNPDVKAFAHKMVVDHEGLEAKMKPFADAWGLQAPSGVDEDHQKALDKLNSLSGNDFDKQYMDDMVSDHAKAYDAFTKEAKDTHDTKFKAAVIQGKSVVAAHKNMAYDLKKKL
jgi:putative membrane protein